MKRTRTVYSKDFKDKAVELSIQRGNIAEVARELGVSSKYIERWKSLYQNEKEGYKTRSAESEEIKRLKKEMNDMRMERDILKKAVSIFSKSDR